MGRIIYLNPFVATNITGGIKTAYRQVELLCELGYDACVWQPAGKLTWMDTSAPVLHRFTAPEVRPDDVLVFPEVLHVAALHPFLQVRNGAMKLLFCQNQFNVFNQFIPTHDYASLGFAGVFCPSLAARNFLEQVLGVSNAAVVPCFVDTELFRPSPKKLQILAITSKLPEKAIFIAHSLRARRTDARDVPIILVKDKAEGEIARLMAESAILLALGHRESFGLVALEAMAAGCLVTGFHGYGGLEFAAPDNGLWFWSDQEEAVAEALHRLILGVRHGEAWTQDMAAAGLAVAKSYSRQRTREALRAYFGSLGVNPALTR